MFKGEKMHKILEQAVEEGKKMTSSGRTAKYIPDLGRVNKDYLGVCICTGDGQYYQYGDADVRFTIQSIS